MLVVPPILFITAHIFELNEAYYWFSHSVMHVFSVKIKTVERENISAMETIDTLNSLKKSLKSRISEKFIPMKVREIFKKQTEMGQMKKLSLLREAFLHDYSRCDEYLNEWT